MTVRCKNSVTDVGESMQLFSYPLMVLACLLFPTTQVQEHLDLCHLHSHWHPSTNLHVPTAWELPQGTSAPAGVPLIQPPAIVTSVKSTDLSLSMSLHPVPAQIVQQIRSGQFMNMWNLLGDNAAV